MCKSPSRKSVRCYGGPRVKFRRVLVRYYYLCRAYFWFLRLWECYFGFKKRGGFGFLRDFLYWFRGFRSPHFFDFWFQSFYFRCVGPKRLEDLLRLFRCGYYTAVSFFYFVYKIILGNIKRVFRGSGTFTFKILLKLSPACSRGYSHKLRFKHGKILI